MALFLTEADVEKLLRMDDALGAVEEVLRLQGNGAAINRPRSRVAMEGCTLHVMSAGIPAGKLLGLKAYVSGQAGTRFLVNLYGAEEGRLLAVIEADRLGQMRTGAASGVATRHMAREDATSLGIIGTGWQARSQLQAICRVRPIARIAAFGRDPDRRRAFCAEMSAALGIEVEPAANAREAVTRRDIVVTATTARDPVLLGGWLAPGTHVNAMGSNVATKRELDEGAVRKAATIAVDSLEQAKIEGGDLLPLVEKGTLRWEEICELGEIVAGKRPGRQRDQEITLFESHGIALWDVAVGARIYEKAVAAGVGSALPF